MEIFVDADACPVKAIIVRLAKRRGLPVTMVADTSHRIADGYSRVFTVDKARDSVDIKLINLVHPGDIVITQDYGVAAMALGKRCRALHQNGFLYDEGNIDRLLFERHMGQKARRTGGRTGGAPKRTREDDLQFERALERLLDASAAERTGFPQD
ncbi:MAG: YaiI/YqxD family protein [Oscillospiraceae bacterium]